MNEQNKQGGKYWNVRDKQTFVVVAAEDTQTDRQLLYSNEDSSLRISLDILILSQIKTDR